MDTSTQVPIAEIKDLVPDPKNARRHTRRNVETIVDALRDVGAARSIVIDEDNVVLAGNATIAAAADAGITKLQVVDADGHTMIAVRRHGLTPEQKTRLALYDNLAEWDVAMLQALQHDGMDLSAFWHDDEFAALCAADRTPTAGQTDPDDVPPERRTDVAIGDVFALGAHRLVCGDARRAATLSAVMEASMADGTWTDPPFGVSYVGKTVDALVVHGDRASELAPLLRDAFHAVSPLLNAGAAIYVAHPAGPNAVVFGQAFIDAGWHFHQGLVWVKDAMVLGHSDYHYEHEGIIYGWKPGAARTWVSDRTQVTVFHIDRPKVSRDHPTIKPVALVVQQIGNNVAAGGVILDPFAGSGTTLIAAEQLGLSCRAVELSPAYCQVIIDRWEAFMGSGAKAVKTGHVSPAPDGGQ
jgi:DNA modification methylase